MTTFAAFALGGMCYVTGHVKFSQYLQIPYFQARGADGVLLAVVGATIGFLWWNCYPADVFMGTGSLSLGAALGTVAS